MARLLGAGEHPVYTIQDIQSASPPDYQPIFDPNYIVWVIPNISTMVQLMHKTAGRGLALAIMDREDIIPGNQGFEIGSGKYAHHVAIYMLQGKLQFGEHLYQNVFIGIGDHVALKGFTDVGESSTLIKAVLGGGDIEANVGRVQTTKAFTTITTPTPFGFNTTEEGLFVIINSPTEYRETKIISTCIFLFPYIKNIIKNFVSIIDYNRNLPTIGEGLRGGTQPGSSALSGEQLSLLALFILGPAYSLDTKLNDQIARRVKAAAASMQLPTLSSLDMAGLINRVGWRAGDISPIIDDVLAAVICIKEDLTVDPEAPLATLASTTWLKENAELTSVGAELLEQARLVYRNYHATSISFVPIIIPRLEQLLGPDSTLFGTEITAFRAIIDTVTGSPFMGLRSKLPEKFHIKNFPKLVYCALKYHESSLTDPNDVSSFRLYKVVEIKNHVTSLQEQKMVEDIAKELPPPSTAALAQLAKSLPLDRATSLMDRKTPEEQRDVIALLKSDENKGAWAQAAIDRSDAELQKTMLREAKKLLTDLSSKRFELAREKSDLILNNDQRRLYLTQVNEWKSGIVNQIEGLEPWETSITEAVSQSQITMRTTLIGSIRGIMDQINNTPVLPQ